MNHIQPSVMFHGYVFTIYCACIVNSESVMTYETMHKLNVK